MRVLIAEDDPALASFVKRDWKPSIMPWTYRDQSADVGSKVVRIFRGKYAASRKRKISCHCSEYCAMKRRRNKAAGPNHERWLVSYADFITLLFGLFVV